VSFLRRVLPRPSGWRGAACRLHDPESARQSGGAQPPQTQGARGRPARTGGTESRVVNRFQSAAEDARLRFYRTSGRSAASVYPVRPGKIAGFLTAVLTGYKRLISPLLPSACRFYPTCSDYMREAVETHGPAQGVWLGLKRLGRCHPFHEGGFDAVPERKHTGREAPPPEEGTRFAAAARSVSVGANSLESRRAESE
jgi:uncharacterized protein